MWPRDDSMHVIEFDDFFIIRPAIVFNNYGSENFTKTAHGEKGKAVPLDFEYNSFNTPHYLNVEEIKDFLAKVK